MNQEEIISNIHQALGGEIPFNQWLENQYFNWSQEHPMEAPRITRYAQYLSVELRTLIYWLTEGSKPPTDPELIQKLWDKYRFVYCFVADTPPPESLFPEGSSPREIRDAFENLRTVLTSNAFLFEEVGNVNSVLESMLGTL